MEELKSELNIKTLLDEWVSALPPKDYGHISPSSLGGCPRVHYWRIKGIKETTPPSTGALLNFQVGFLWEELWDKALKWKGTDYKSQVKFAVKDHNIAGTCDFLIKTGVDGKGEDTWEIWDSKTQGSKWFWNVESAIKRGAYDPQKEELNYILQQAAYIWMARQNGYNVTRARLAYISKDDGMVGRITNIVLTDKLETMLLGRINYLNDCLKTDTLPDCECDGWKRGYCSYGELASQERNRTKKLVNTKCCQEEFVLRKETV